MERVDNGRMRAVVLGVCVVVALVVQATSAQQGGARPGRLPRVPQRVLEIGGRKVVEIEGRRAVAGDVLVKWRRALAAGERAQFAAQTDADEDRAIGNGGIRLLHSKSFDTDALLAFLRTHPDVLYAEPNYVVEADAADASQTIPNDPRFGEQWALHNTGQEDIAGVGTPGTPGADIDAPKAWEATTGSKNIVVAVVDTGIDYFNSDLFPNMWSASAPFTVTIGTQNITCGVGTHGFNVLTNTCIPYDDNGHGTYVAGIIGAAGNDAYGVTGINWNTSMMAVKFLDSTGLGTTANAIKAISFVVQAADKTGANIRVVNGSWSSGLFSQLLLDEINRANDRNMLFVASAGNSGRDNDVTLHYPSGYSAPNVISVAATDNKDMLWSSSNYGLSSVHLGAPGVNVISTAPSDAFAWYSGTSGAAPHVSGAAALLLAKCTTLNTAALKSALLNTVDVVPALVGRVSTAGRLNVGNAMAACMGSQPDFTVSASPGARSMLAGENANYAATITAAGGFSGTVTFSVSGVPAGATAIFSPTSVTASGSSTLTITSSPTTPPGNYPLMITGTSGTLTHTAAVTLTIADRLTTTTVTSNVNPFVYGGQVTLTATVATSTGLPGGTVTFKDGPATIGSAPLSGDVIINSGGGGKATLITSALGGGTHSITAVYSGDGTYDGSTSAPLSQVVIPAQLTIIADAKTRVYGAPNPPLTFNYSGFVNGDTVASLTAPPTVTTAATPGSPVGTYSINASGAASPNYTFTYVIGTLTVTPAPLTITADNQTKTYGAPTPPLTAKYSGFVNGDSEASLTTPPTVTTAPAASGVGTYPITVSGAASANYTISYVNGALTVTPATLTITADNKTRSYGAANPPLTVNYNGFVNGDSAASLTTPPAVTTAPATSGVGTYPITVSGAASANYTINYVNGTLTVTAAALTVTANDQSRVHGAANPPLTFSYTGFVNGDTAASVTTAPAAATTATAASAVGTYPITVSGAAAPNYAIVYVNGSLTVVPNAAPSFTKGANQAVLEDTGAQSVAGWATGLSAGSAYGESAQALNFIVTNSNNTLFAVQPAIAADGTLTYTPAANANGSATVSIQLRDNGGTAGGGVDTSAAQAFTVTVMAVNDAPGFTAGPNQTVSGSSAQTVSGWATAISAGAANETDQSLNFVVTTSNNALFSVLPAVSAAGVLTYTPAAGANGSATVTVHLHDNGGTANGGVDTSAARTFTITVTPPAGPPSVSIADVSVVEGNVVCACTDAVFTVSLSSPSSQTVTVSYTTLSGTAMSPKDYVWSQGVVTFAPGDVSKTIIVKVGGDTTRENNETFSVRVSDPVNATLAKATGVGTIMNDD
jgi:subtilisin family serine protease